MDMFSENSRIFFLAFRSRTPGSIFSWGTSSRRSWDPDLLNRNGQYWYHLKAYSTSPHNSKYSGVISLFIKPPKSRRRAHYGSPYNLYQNWPLINAKHFIIVQICANFFPGCRDMGLWPGQSNSVQLIKPKFF